MLFGSGEVVERGLLLMEMNVHQSVVQPAEKIAITTKLKRKPFSQQGRLCRISLVTDLLDPLFFR
jgi:hypothetical protein